MSVDNVPLFGSAFAPSSSQRKQFSKAQPFRKSATSLADFQRQLITFELLIVILAGSIAALIVSQESTSGYPLLVAAAFTGLWVIALVATGAFALANIDSFAGVKRIMQASAIAFGTFAGLGLVLGSFPFRTQVLWELAVGIPTILLTRYASIRRLRAMRLQGEARVAVLLVSPSNTRGSLTREVLDDGRFELVGAVDPNTLEPDAIISRIADQAISEDADAVMISCSTAVTPDSLRKLAWALEGHDIKLLVSSRVKSFATGRASVQRVANELVIEVDHSHQALVPHLVKRLFDIVASAALLVLFAPVILISAIAIRAESRGPAFFVQPRVGERGVLFPFYKLRSMRQDAHLERADTLGPTDEGILDRYRNDDRITRVGSFIRRWSIDELPQLLNVLLGHMSIVGPRPVLEEELHDLPVDGERVHLAKPGLTGLWQISGRKEIHWEDRIDLDLEYVDTWSLSLDAKIAAKTASAVLKGSGAY